MTKIKNYQPAFHYLQKYLTEHPIGYDIKDIGLTEIGAWGLQFKGITECLKFTISNNNLAIFAYWQGTYFDLIYDDDVSIERIGKNYQCMVSGCQDVCSRETEYEVWADHVFSNFETWLKKHLKQNAELFFVDLKGVTFCEIKTFENMTDIKNYYAKYSDADFFKAVQILDKGTDGLVR